MALERQHDELTEMEGKSTRILNRVIVAGALAVPMGLGASGIAVADVPADSSVLPTLIAASEDDDLKDCDDEDRFFGLFGGGGHSNSAECAAPAADPGRY